MAIGDNGRAWHQAARDRGHLLRLDEDGQVDNWVVDTGNHNGPGCELCHMSWCMWCVSSDEIRACSSPAIVCEYVELDENNLPKRALLP